MRDVAIYATSALDSGSGNGPGFKCGTSLPHLLEIYRISFLCAGRTTASEDDQGEWKADFFQLRVRLEESLRLISIPEAFVTTEDVFRAQCALDMAMRTCMKVPDVINESFVRALLECSVKMFDARVNELGWYEDGTIRRRNNVPVTDATTGSVPEVDWDKALRGEKYVVVRLCDDGDYGDEWSREDLQFSYKRRIEFLWAKFRPLEKEFRSILAEFEVVFHSPVLE